MDKNGPRESSNRAVGPKDSTSTTTTLSTTLINTVKSDPMIIPTSAPVVKGAASPSPSKRMRYELVISTPIHDDRKSAFVSSPQRFVGQEFVGKIADGDNDDCSKDGGLEKCDRLKEDETVGDVEKADNDNDDESIKASLVIGRGGFRLLDDAKDGFEGNETSFKEKERTFSLLQRDQTLQLSGVENLQIKAMLPERYGKPISTGHVLVAQIFDRTKSAIFLQAICQAFRLPENYYHLKRLV